MTLEDHLRVLALADPPPPIDTTRLRSRLCQLWGNPTPDALKGGRPAPVHASDVHLLRTAQAGDLSALNALVGRHLPKLLGYAKKQLGPAGEDAVQAAMADFTRKLRSLQITGDNIEALLFTFVRNRVKDAQRRRAREAARRPPPDDQTIDDEAIDGEAAAILRVELHLLAKALHHACTALEQDVIDLLRQGYAYREVGERLAITANYVGVLRNSALAKLREYFDR